MSEDRDADRLATENRTWGVVRIQGDLDCARIVWKPVLVGLINE